MRRFGCGTETRYCVGSRMETHQGMQQVHSTPQEAFKCYKKYLMEIHGFEPVGQRELRGPAGNALGVTGVLVLSKPSHFGAEFRGGKREKIQATKRLNMKNGRAGYIA